MISKSVIFSSLFLLSTLATIGATAHAGSINTFGTTCQAENGSDAHYLDYLSSGLYNPQIFSVDVTCGIPRSPLLPSDYIVFYIDGFSNYGTPIDCTLWVRGYNGDLHESRHYTISKSGSWDQPMTLAPGTVYNYDYVGVSCTLPSGAGIFGVTAVQP